MNTFQGMFSSPEALSQIIGAIIGLVGMLVGTLISIVITFLIRNLDLKKEKLKEEMSLKKAKADRELEMKEEIYSEFLSELAYLENFLTKKSTTAIPLKDMANFDGEWTKVEIKVDLIANEEVRKLKEPLQTELMTLAEKRFEGKLIELTSLYTENRDKLLNAIRKDIDIFQN